MKKSANKAGSKLSSYEPGQIVRGLDLSAYRVTSKVAGPEGAVVKLANLQGEPVSPPANFIPVGPRMAHIASAMFFHLAYNKDFDLYVRAYCEQAGLPIPIGPNGKEFEWAKWFQSTVSPKLIVPGLKGDDAQAVKDEAIHEMLFTELSHRDILSKFKSAIKNFSKDVTSLPLANQLTVYLVKNFRGRVEEMNRKIKGGNPDEEISMMQDSGDDEEYNVIETEQYAQQPSQYEHAESEHDIAKFREQFYEWLKKHQSEKSAKWFITLFDIYWNWISDTSETEDDEGRPSFMPARRHLEPEWAEQTGLSNASLYDYIGRLAKLLEQFIKNNRTTLGEGHIFVKLVDGIHAQREALKKQKKPKQKAMPARAALAALNLAVTDEDAMKPLTGGSPAMSMKELHERMSHQASTGAVTGAINKTAKLVRGDQLTPEMEQQVKDAFIYRWTSDNPKRTQVYKCDQCDIQNPYVNMSSAEGHSHPTIPLQTDADWIKEHAFYFTNADKLMPNRSAEPNYLAKEEPQQELPLQAAADTFDCCGGYKPRHKEGCPVYEKNFTETMDRLKNLPKKAEFAGDELTDASANILEARGDDMLTSEDWKLLMEAVMVSAVGREMNSEHAVVRNARALLKAATDLVEAKKNQMVTSEEWDALAKAYQEATGNFIDWRKHDEKGEEFGEKQSTEPLQQLRPDITPGDTGRLPHATKEGAGPVTPQQMQTQNVQKSQGVEPPPPTPQQQSVQTDNPMFAIAPDSGSGEDVPMKKTVPPELPNQNFHMGSAETVKVPVSDAEINMSGPYLTATADCPFCGKENVLLHTESHNSPVKPQDICQHIKAMEWDENGSRVVEFSKTAGYMSDQQMMQEFFRPRTEREEEQDYRDRQPVSEATKMRRGLGEPAVKRHEGSEKSAALKTEQNTPEMEQEVEQLIAAHPLTEVHKGCTPVFEHGQWWVTCGPCGAIFSVVDAEGGMSIEGLDLEELESGDESCMESFTASADKTAGDDAIFADKKRFFDSVKHKHHVK